MEQQARRAGWLILGAAALGCVVAAVRLLTLSGFSNDHFFYLTRGVQILEGAWPVRDFVDPGFPLVLWLSAAAQSLSGGTLAGEAILVALAFGASAALTVLVCARWTGSVWLACWAAVTQAVIMPRSYGYPKLLVYVLAAGAFVRYARQPTRSSVTVIAVVTAVAFFLRHDHGVYVAVGAALLLATQGGGRLIGAGRRLTWYALIVGILIAPYLAFVHQAEGLTRYFAEAIAFSARESRRTSLVMPSLTGMTAWSTQWLAVVGYYLFWLTPVAALAVAWLRSGIDRGARAVTTAFAVMTLAMNVGFLRDPLVARVPDAVAPFTLLAAWIAAQWVARPRPSTALSPARAGVAAVCVLTLVAAGQLGNAPEMLRRAELLRLPPRPQVRWRDVMTQLREPYNERQMPSDAAFSLVPFYQYVQACSPPQTRILALGFAPELAYYARRGFAGGHPSLYRGYFDSEPEQRQVVDRLDRELVLFVVGTADGFDAFGGIPIVKAYVDQRFVPMADFPVDGDEAVRVLVHRSVTPAPRYAGTEWPCPYPQG